MKQSKRGIRLASVLFAVLGSVAAPAADAAAEALSNADIVSMTRANISPMIIINRIYSVPNTFDLSDQAFSQLKENGVADEVLTAMLAAAKVNEAASAADSAIQMPAFTGANSGGVDASLPSLTPPQLDRKDASSASAASMFSFSDMPGFDDLPAFGEMPNFSSSKGEDFSAPPSGTPPPAASRGDAAAAPNPSQQTTDQGAFSAPPAITVPAVVPAAAPSGMPSVSAPPSLPRQASAPAVPDISAPPSLPAFSQAPAQQAPAQNVGAALTPVAATPSAPVSPLAPTPPPAARQMSAPTGIGGALDNVRFERELLAIVQGTPEGQRTGLAWMVANRDASVPMLRQMLTANRPEYQAASLRALGSMNDQESLGLMRDMLGEPSPLVRQYAAEALAEMNDSLAIAAAEQNLGRNVDPMDGLIRLVGYARLARASGSLGSILSSDASELNRAAAAWALARIGPAGATAWPAVEKALTADADASVRREAAGAVASFHNQSSAKMLQNACRKDPDVRKVTLEALAEYPESVSFLIGVMNLGAEMIAPDELEAAAKSLAKLTGQNFNLDGARWQAWYNDNKSRFETPAASNAVLADAPSSPVAAPPADSPVPGAPPATAMGQIAVTGGSGTAASASQPDISRLGIIIDPSDIPMAPEVDDRFQTRAAAAPVRAPGAGLMMTEGGATPEPLSVSDFSSEPGSLISAGNETQTPAVGSNQAAGPFSSQWGDGISLDLPSNAESAEGMAGGPGSGEEQMWGGSMSSPSAMPTQSVVTGMAGGPLGGGGSDADAPGGAIGGGVRLALPPMADDDFGGDAGMSSGLLGSVAAGAAATSGDTGSSSFGTVSGGETSLYDSSFSGVDGDGFSDSVVGTPYESADVTSSDSGVFGDDMGQTSFYDAAEAMGAGGDVDGAASISFPGDTSTFGLGEPIFTDSGMNPEASSASGISGSDTGYPQDVEVIELNTPTPICSSGGLVEYDDDGFSSAPMGQNEVGETVFYDGGSDGSVGFTDSTGGVMTTDGTSASEGVQIYSAEPYSGDVYSGEIISGDIISADPGSDSTYSTDVYSGEVVSGDTYSSEFYSGDTTGMVEWTDTGEVFETGSDDDDKVWVRGVGLIDRNDPAAVESTPTKTVRSPAAPVQTPPDSVVVDGATWEPAGDEAGDSYVIVDDGFVDASEVIEGYEAGGDIFDNSMPAVGGDLISSPSGAPLLGEEIWQDVPEDNSSSPSAAPTTSAPSRRLRKQR